MLNKIEKMYSDNVVIKDYMVHRKARPHTRPVADLTECCNGRITAEYYFWARYFDKIDDELAKGMVSELKKLQITDPDSEHFGCMRWYREETFVTDTNGAFFVLLPLVTTYIFCKEKLTTQEKTDIESLVKNASTWFLKEISGTIYYSNKIMSDGAMSAAISFITGSGEEECNKFWEKWLDYVNERGFGWGENTSDGYMLIMINALNLALYTMKDAVLKERIRKAREQLLDYLAFHGGKAIVPSIRTYNFKAAYNYGGALYKIFALNDSQENSGEGITPLMAITALETGMKFDTSKNYGSVKCERVFDSSYAYTWKGNGIRLGTLSKFPAMKNCYQREGWGLAWQTMPACALVEDVHVAFLRMRTKVGDNTRSHPATDKHSAFLSNRIFEDGNLVTVNTVCSQTENIAIVSRSMQKLANTASELRDEWCIPKGYDSIKTFESNAAVWYIVSYKKCALAITNLGGIAHSDKKRGKLDVETSKCGDFDVISAKLYSGEEKMIFAERLESVWVVAAIDGERAFEDVLMNLEIEDKEMCSDYVPTREIGYMREVSCRFEGNLTKLLILPDEEIIS